MPVLVVLNRQGVFSLSMLGWGKSLWWFWCMRRQCWDPFLRRFLHSYKGLCGGNVPLVNTSVTGWWGDAWSFCELQRTKLWTNATMLQGSKEEGNILGLWLSWNITDLTNSGTLLLLDFLLWERIQMDVVSKLTWILVTSSCIYTKLYCLYRSMPENFINTVGKFNFNP